MIQSELDVAKAIVTGCCQKVLKYDTGEQVGYEYYEDVPPYRMKPTLTFVGTTPETESVAPQRAAAKGGIEQLLKRAGSKAASARKAAASMAAKARVQAPKAYQTAKTQLKKGLTEYRDIRGKAMNNPVMSQVVQKAEGSAITFLGRTALKIATGTAVGYGLANLAADDKGNIPSFNSAEEAIQWLDNREGVNMNKFIKRVINNQLFFDSLLNQAVKDYYQTSDLIYDYAISVSSDNVSILTASLDSWNPAIDQQLLGMVSNNHPKGNWKWMSDVYPKEQDKGVIIIDPKQRELLKANNVVEAVNISWYQNVSKTDIQNTIPEMFRPIVTVKLSDLDKGIFMKTFALYDLQDRTKMNGIGIVIASGDEKGIDLKQEAIAYL